MELINSDMGSGELTLALEAMEEGVKDGVIISYDGAILHLTLAWDVIREGGKGGVITSKGLG